MAAIVVKPSVAVFVVMVMMIFVVVVVNVMHHTNTRSLLGC